MANDIKICPRCGAKLLINYKKIRDINYLEIKCSNPDCVYVRLKTEETEE